MVLRVKQGPIGLARHPMFTIEEQMKPRKSNTQNSGGVSGRSGGIDVAAWAAQENEVQATVRIVFI